MQSWMRNRLSIFCIVLAFLFLHGGDPLAAQGSRPALSSANITQARELMRIEGGESDIRSYEFSPDGSLLAVGTVAGVKIFSGFDPAVPPRGLGGGEAYDVNFSPDGTRLISNHADSKVRVWDVASGALIQDGIDGGAVTATYSPDGSTILALTKTEVEAVDATTFTIKFNFDQGGRTVFPFFYTPDSTRLIGVAYNADYTQSVIYIWDATTGGILHQIEFAGLADLRMSRDGKYIGTLYYDGQFYKAAVWSVADGTQLLDLPTNGEQDNQLTAFAFDNMNRVLTARTDILAWGMDGSKTQFAPNISDWPLTAMSFSNDWSFMLAGSSYRSLIALDGTTGTVIGEMIEAEGGLQRIVFNPTMSTFFTVRILYSYQSASGKNETSLRLWGIPQAGDSLSVHKASDPITTEVVAAPATDAPLRGNIYFSASSGNRNTGIDIYKLDVQGTAPQPLTDAPGHDTHGTISPDGTKIVYTSANITNDRSELIVMDIDGNKRVLLPDSQNFVRPVWSPDGTKIAGTGYDPERDRPVIMIVNADGTGLQNLTPDHFGTLPKFSPDGKLLLFRHRAERDQQQIDAVAVVNVDGTGFRIVAEELYSNGATFSVNEYDWSPDGRYIAYTNDHTGAPEIAIVGVDGTGNRIITNRVRDMGSVEPFWSPDGQLIMFSTGTLGTGYNNNLEIGGFAIGAALHINVMNADGTDVRQLTKMTSVPAAWSPDGRFILYRSYEDSFMRLRVMKRDGSDDREIIKGVDYDFSAMGDVAWLLTSSANQPAQAVVVVPPPPTRAPITETLPLDLASIQPVQRNSDWTPQIVKVDDVEMVVVPPGCFMMGEPDTRDQYRQAHQLCFDKAYLIDRFEVTNAVIDLFQFKPGHAAFNKLPNYPRENIDWYEASEFCRLRGGHLPTEAEWEYAARGPDGLEFANGNEENGVTSAANSGTQPMNRALRDRTWTNAVDMQGNVEEWTSSYYTQYPYNAQDGREDPSYTSNRVIRGIGGSLWYRAGAAASTDWGIHRGFRCARGETETTVGTFISSTTTPMPPEPTQPSAPAIEPTATPIIIVATAPVIDCPDTPPTQFVVGMRGTVLPFADGTARPVNVRDVPARSGEVVIKMGANTMFTIVGGPICADGFLWWQIAIDDGPTGWAAEGSMENYFLDPVARG